MNHDTLSRWQFGITTVYHFVFVPLTIGLSLLVAGMHTAWYRTGRDEWRRATQFWGKLFLINFAIGVVTGIVQEFQFGMNWSAYSRVVGDIFGAPLAMEGLLAFFLESTFLGLWIFGWNRIPKGLHLASIWLASIGTVISAYFILAANSWMQHPVGWRFNEARGRAELTSIWAVLTNKVQLVTFPHVVLGALLTGAMVVVGVSAWHLRRGRDVLLFTKSMRVGLVVGFLSAVAVAGVGHLQGQVMTQVQPMKMASAEALWHTERGADFSLFAIGDVNGGENKVDLAVPNALSLLATDSPNGTVQGVTELQQEYAQRFGAGDYTPIMPVTYWTFRLMIGFGMLAALVTFVGLVQMRRGRLLANRRLLTVAVWASALPFLANSVGWIFTEMGRQPWLVFGVLRTADGVSPNVSTASVVTTLVGFTALYGVLAVIAFGFFLKQARRGPEPEPESVPEGEKQPEPELMLAY
ncbi:MAG TPA: cytochrome ubiquinol oxidase subunit I [Frankiaceae bacterium]|nr:cytochrome ubiquinol oxidase subunit I [Frankiaceae bacterium]